MEEETAETFIPMCAPWKAVILSIWRSIFLFDVFCPDSAVVRQRKQRSKPCFFKINFISKLAKSSTRITSTVNALGDKIDAIEAGALSEEEMTSLLEDIATVKNALSDLSETDEEVAGLNEEVDLILAQLQTLLAADAAYEGNLVIKNLTQLELALERISIGADDPGITVNGNVDIDNSDASLDSSQASLTALLTKLKVVMGTATITSNSDVDLATLRYVTGGLSLSGTGAIAAAALTTIDGALAIDIAGDIFYPGLSTVSGGIVLSQTSTVTGVDFSGLTAGTFTTSTTGSEVNLPNAIIVKIPGVLPATVNLPKATEFVSTYNGAAQTATTITVGGADATFDLNATGFTGTVTITSTGAVNLDKITTAVALNVNATEISAIGLTTIAGATTLSATTVDLSALKTTTDSLTLVGPTAVSLPELTTLEGGFVALQAESFSAPKYTTTTGTVDIKDGGTYELKSIADETKILDFGNLTQLTLVGQVGDIDVSTAVAMATLDYTGAQITPVGPGVQNNTLSIGAANVSLTTLSFGEDSYLGFLVVDNSALTSLSTAGVIIFIDVYNNASLETFDFGHSHLDGDNASEVTINDNPKITAVDLSSLGKVKRVVITTNNLLTSIIAPASGSDQLAEPVAPISVVIRDNKLSGTYTPAVAATETSAYVPAAGTSAEITSFKTFITAYTEQTRTAPVSYDIYLDSVDNTATSATETVTLSSLLDADTVAHAGPDSDPTTLVDNQSDNGAPVGPSSGIGSGVNIANELALF